MDTYGPPQALYYVGDALECLAYIAGIAAGIIAITRKRTLPGILAASAFFLLALELLVRFIIWNILVNVVNDFTTLNWASYCISTPLLIIGISALVAVIFIVAGKKTILPPPVGPAEPPPQP